MISVCLGFLLWQGSHAYAQQVDKPNFKEGDTWQFNVNEKDFVGSISDNLHGLYELGYSGGGVKIFSLENSQKTEIGSKGPAKQLLILLGLFEDRPDLKFPLKVGEKWTYDYDYSQRGSGKSRSASVEIKVAGVEEVSVPAGKFTAFKLVKEELRGGGRKSPGQTVSTTYYYSTDTKSVVKSSYNVTSGANREIELVKFTAGK
jgi:hypothetical protein